MRKGRVNGFNRLAPFLAALGNGNYQWTSYSVLVSVGEYVRYLYCVRLSTIDWSMS
jgi:hypothetical protein